MPNSCAPAVRLGRGALGMGDAAARGHPVDRAGPDRLQGAEAVAVGDLAADQVSDRGEADVRMRAHVDPLPQQKLGRTHLIEKDERSDHLAARRRQRPAHLEAAEVTRPRHDDHLDRSLRLLLVAPRVPRRLPAHSPASSLDVALGLCWRAAASASSRRPSQRPLAWTAGPADGRALAGARLKQVPWPVATRRESAGRGSGPGPRARRRSSW